MGHSRTPTQNTAGDGFPADPIDGSERALSVAGCPRTCGYFDMRRRPEVPNRGEPQPFLSAGHEGDDHIGGMAVEVLAPAVIDGRPAREVRCTRSMTSGMSIPWMVVTSTDWPPLGHGLRRRRGRRPAPGRSTLISTRPGRASGCGVGILGAPPEQPQQGLAGPAGLL